jgi:DNA-binding transcriptional LysR family regulator
MHLKSLKVFCDVVGRRSFSRAASENGISQSGASQIVNALEEHLGVQLIDRTKRPFVLTPEGEAYYEGCRKLVQRYFALEEEVKTLHEEVAGRVSVASIYSIGLSHINRFVQRFLQSYPKANVRVQYQHPNRVYELVESDQVDLGLVSYPRSSRTIKATTWREEPMVLVCAPGHRLASRERIGLEELHGLEIIAFDADLEIRHEIDRALAAKGIEVRIVMEFDNTETIKRAVEIDAGVSLLPAPTVDREIAAGALVARPLAGVDLKRPIGIIQRRGKELGKTASRFMHLLLKQPSSSREIADLDEAEAPLGGDLVAGKAASDSDARDDSAVRDDEDIKPAAAKPDSAAARVAS